MSEDSSSAGAGARREYQRRAARDEARIRETWGQGKLGTLAVALSLSGRAPGPGASGRSVKKR